MKWLMRMGGKVKKKDGFTLIELMVVLVIIAILAIAAVPTYMYFVHRAYESEANASLGAIKTAQVVYYAEHGYFTPTWSILGMTSSDFAHNRWWEGDCFGLLKASSTDFTAYAHGPYGKPEVNDIFLKLSNTGDIVHLTTADDTGLYNFLP